MEKPKLYLDEDITYLLARILRDMGYDVVSAHEINMRSRSDEEQMLWAVNEQRAILTCNISHFTSLARKCYATGMLHYGIIVTPQIEFKEMLKRTLALLENTSQEELKNRYVWL